VSERRKGLLSYDEKSKTCSKQKEEEEEEEEER